MSIVFGFAGHRRAQLEAEFLRVAEAMPALGAERIYLAGDLAFDTISAASDLEILVVQDTEERPGRRADFFLTHLRPRVGTRFHVFTPAEFEAAADGDPWLRRLLAVSPPVQVG